MQQECNELKLNKAETRMYKSRAYFMRRENWVQHLHHQQQHCKLKKKCISRISLHFSAIHMQLQCNLYIGASFNKIFSKILQHGDDRTYICFSNDRLCRNMQRISFTDPPFFQVFLPALYNCSQLSFSPMTQQSSCIFPPLKDVQFAASN